MDGTRLWTRTDRFSVRILIGNLDFKGRRTIGKIQIGCFTINILPTAMIPWCRPGYVLVVNELVTRLLQQRSRWHRLRLRYCCIVYKLIIEFHFASYFVLLVCSEDLSLSLSFFHSLPLSLFLSLSLFLLSPNTCSAEEKITLLVFCYCCCCFICVACLLDFVGIINR